MYHRTYIYCDAVLAGPQKLRCCMTSIIFDGRESWSFSSMAEPCSPLLNNTGHRTLRKHSWQPCRTSLRRHPKKMSVETPDFPSVKLARNTSKNIRIKKCFLITGVILEIYNKEWFDPSKKTNYIDTSFRKLNQSSKKFDGISMNGSKGLVSTASIALVEYLFQRAHTQCISTTTKSTTTQPPVWAMLTFRHGGRSLSAKVGRLYHGKHPLPGEALLHLDPKHTIILVWSIWLHKYPLDLSFWKRWWSKHLNHLLDFGS